MTFNANRLLLLVAVICFILAAFRVDIPVISIGWLGLAFLAAAGLV